MDNPFVFGGIVFVDNAVRRCYNIGVNISGEQGSGVKIPRDPVVVFG